MQIVLHRKYYRQAGCLQYFLQLAPLHFGLESYCGASVTVIEPHIIRVSAQNGCGMHSPGNYDVLTRLLRCLIAATAACALQR